MKKDCFCGKIFAVALSFIATIFATALIAEGLLRRLLTFCNAFRETPQIPCTDYAETEEPPMV